MRVMDQLIEVYGKPQVIRVDNGPEMTSQGFIDCAELRGLKLLFIQPDKPNQNAFIERFNKSFRVEMQKAADEWLMERNEYRAVLNAAGASVEDIVRLTWCVIDKREYLARQAEVGKAYRDIMGRHFPAMTMVVVSGLVEDRALLEIEATAVISRSHARD